MDYNKTINLPQTDFPMRAGLPKREPDMLQRWNDMDLYNEMLKKNEGKPLFSLHDGPPFSNGNLHMGHALNKSLKDFITRMYAMRGYYTPYIPGWDNHGMPIESAIIKEQKLNRKQMSVPEFRTACHNYAQKYIDIQMEGFKRIGVLADWEHPYKTMDPGFEAEEVKVFGEMYKKGYIYKGLKPVYWCPNDETALAEAEIEYQDDPCTTVYVKFQMKDDQGKLAAYDHSKLYFVIWTTTIWTLPGNLAIALHPDESYALVKAPNGETYIMAEALVEKVMKVGGFDSWEIAETHPGSFFENMLAQHPFLDKTSRLLLADYVTMDSGTGCVHTAPGFGADDYQTCRRYGMEMVVPVDDRGRHTDYAGKYAGMKTEESNPVILADMKESGALFASEEIVHSYPHCWRCKKPIIFRATPQWFCSVDAFKDEACAACDDVRWVPGWGIDRMKSMIRERADWCISRQRRWGLPIPVFYCKDCGKPICTDETIAAVSKLFGEKGSNAWYEMEASEILPADFACPHCGSKGGFTKEEDTLDGWFDSGSMPFAQHHYPFENKELFEQQFPANFISEAVDQTRGWFYSLLAESTLLFNKAPYKNVIVLGHVQDENGQKMSKSKGNAVDPFDALNKYGADAIRWYFYINSAPWLPNRFHGKAVVEGQRKFMSTLWNTYAFFVLYADIDNFDPTKYELNYDQLPVMDKWLLSRLNTTVQAVDNDLANYKIPEAARALQEFVDEMSNWYVRRSRERFWAKGMEQDKINAYMTLYHALVTIAKTAAPMIPFMTEDIYQNLVRSVDKDAPESIHLCDFPTVNEAWIDKDLEADMKELLEIVVLGRACRNTANIKNRQPIGTMYVKAEKKMSEFYTDIIADELNVKEVKFADDVESFISYSFKPQLRTVGPKYGKLLGGIRQALTDINGTAAMNELRTNGVLKLDINGNNVELTEEDLLIETAQTEGYVSEFDGETSVVLDTNLTPELIEEGFVREIISKIQTMRKEAGFEVMDKIVVYAHGNDKIQDVMKAHEDEIKSEVLADEMVLGETDGYVKEWNINKEAVTMGVKKL